MATAQIQRSTASAVTLPNRIATEQQSLVLMKRLLAVSVSCITYLRGLFPEYAYGTRYLEDICVKILREDKNCPGSTQLVKWMLGCYDALEKKYLRMVVLAIYTNIDDPQTITECYQFKFKYTPGGAIMDFSSGIGNSVSACSDVKKASVLLIRKLYILMQDLGPLPNDVCLTMKLLYYDEVTPVGYQPPGFKEGSCENMMFEGEPMYLNVGVVATPFHSLKVRVTTEKERMEHVEENVLKESDSKTPTRALKLDIDEAKLPDRSLNDEPLRDHQADVQKKEASSLHLEDLSLSSQEDRMMETQHDINQPPQKPLPAEKPQANNSRAGNKRQASKESQPLDIFSSQKKPPGTKKRKLSEPKDPI
ncbi:PREDICTED: HORMA domain-containing protein 1 [Nanorana parkeri]|uniref:HORMA domain-containing protein 1 n=1 Tax=Nanorana parkeri TaxID=125878 RepID=UPI0008550675|nr:PREDICTED: HORMA domain-containing protein 1 [Nanorana parkeri]